MAFASVRSEQTGTQGANATSWTITYPATIVAGDLLVLNVANDGSATVQANSSGFSTDKTVANGTACRISSLVKIAAGTETGTFTLTVSASEQGAWRIASYQDWFGTIATGLAFSTGATGTATTPSTNMPDSDSLNPANWDVEDTLWRSIVAADDGRTGFTAFPTNFNLSQNSDASGGAGGAALGGASRQNAVASEDPGPFTIDRSVAWAAYTIAIRPAAAAAYVPRHPAHDFGSITPN